jgi:hypothetical protein
VGGALSNEKQPRWWPPTALCLGLCLFIFGFCFALRQKERGDVLLAPSWERRVNALGFALPVIPACGFLYLAARRTVSAKRALPLLGVLLLSAAGAAAVQVLNPAFLFGPHLRASARNPDGREAGIWFNSFLGCDWELFLSGPHEMLSHQVDRYAAECSATGTPSVRWLEDGGAALDVDGGVPAKPFTLFPAWN